ncbi:MAG: hypothetical protein SVY15_00930 [Halobacteriota archaeon]|nr:hypothetical protein [Halobacteriota archaeon]
MAKKEIPVTLKEYIDNNSSGEGYGYEEKIINALESDHFVNCCPRYTYETSLHKSVGVCGADFMVREPLMMVSKNLEVLSFVPIKHLRMPVGADWKLARSDEDRPFCIFLCKNGHIISGPYDMGETEGILVPIVPPGTIKSPRSGMVNKPPAWYYDMPSEMRSKMWDKLGIEFTPLSDIPDDVKEHLDLENYENNK